MTGGGSITYRSAASGLLNLPGHAGSTLSTNRWQTETVRTYRRDGKRGLNEP